MYYCYQCGKPAPEAEAHGSVVPVCPDHGPCWKLIRSAPVAAVVAYCDGQVLVARRAHEPWLGHWEIPGGFMDEGEHPADAAAREFREEIGLDVTLTGLVAIETTPSATGGWLLHITYCGESAGSPAPDPAEVTEAYWCDPDTLPDPMRSTHVAWIREWRAGRVAPLPFRS